VGQVVRASQATFTPLLVFALKQYSIIKLYTNNRSEENNHVFSMLACASLQKSLNIRLLYFIRQD
jgi:hypothetical protein